MRLSVILIVTAILIVGCDTDSFGVRRVVVVEPFELEKMEAGYFYLRGPNDMEGGYGVLSGTVGKLSWNDTHIVVWQNGDGMGEGWRYIDVKSEFISDLMTITELPIELRGLSKAIENPDVVWHSLDSGDA